MKQWGKPVRLISLGILLAAFWGFPAAAVYGRELPEEAAELSAYQEYKERLFAVEDRNDMEKGGFQVMEQHIFPIETAGFGTVSMIPAVEKEYRRMVLFFTDGNGRVVYRTDQLEANYRNRGTLKQWVQGLSAVSFQDLNRDGRMDIILIVSCRNETGFYAEQTYKIGDVLFQNETGFYRDYRISDKINRFGMNKSVECITAYVRDGYSAEFLYTASTKEELLENGFVIAKEQSRPRRFEKLGYLEVVPGTYTMADLATLMIYLVNEQGYIVWSFQPMGRYDNLYALKGLSCPDIDGDGMKDMIVLARYSWEGENGALLTESDYAIYYQRTGGFQEDTEIKKQYPCGDEDTVSVLVEQARNYWGWSGQ